MNGSVLLDLRHLGPERILTRLPGSRELAMTFAGVDPTTRSLSGRARITTWAEWRRTTGGPPRSTVSTRPVRSRASPSMVRIGSAATP